MYVCMYVCMYVGLESRSLLVVFEITKHAL
jgi:hypothetical protein